MNPFNEELFLERQTRIKETFFSITNAQKNDLTRECANLNADTPAGMMMKFSVKQQKICFGLSLIRGSDRCRREGIHSYLCRHYGLAAKAQPQPYGRQYHQRGTLGGYIGLAECLIALTGKHHGESDRAQEQRIWHHQRHNRH